MKLTILMLLLTSSQVVQAQTITFSVNIIGASDLEVMCDKAIYNNTTFVGYYAENPNPVIKISSTEYTITLPVNEYYVISFVKPETNSKVFKELHIRVTATNTFNIPMNFNSLGILYGEYNKKLKSYQFKTIKR